MSRASLKTIISTLLAAAILLTSVQAMALADSPKDDIRAQVQANGRKSEHDQLRADIAVIESVDLDNLQEFHEQNKEWIEDVNIRLNGYIAHLSEDQRSIALKELREDNSYATVASASDYFDWYTYHYRNGFWTYSMAPKMSTRLLRAYAQAGWNELAAIYYGIRNDNGSLSNQYWCHFDLFVEADWDIEEGRPLVSYPETLLALCNPGGGD